MRNRIDLAKHFNELGFKKGAEIGVADGRYAEILCQEIPGLTLFGIDPWMPYKGNWRSEEYQAGAYKKAKERLDKYDVRLIHHTSIGAYIDEFGEDYFEDDSLDFVFIDGCHTFDNVMLDIILWSRKVKKGGIVSGHDYYHHKAGGVIPAVDTYIKAHNIKLNIIPRYEGGHKDDKAPCWYFTKE
jgi:hypothetical protein